MPRIETAGSGGPRGFAIDERRTRSSGVEREVSDEDGLVAATVGSGAPARPGRHLAHHLGVPTSTVHEGWGAWRLVSRVAALQMLFWTAVGVVFALPSLGSGDVGVLPLWRSLAQWWGWGLLAPLIAVLTRRLDRRGAAGRLIGHVASGLVVAWLALYLSTAMAAMFGLESWSRLVDPSLPGEALRGGFLWGLVVYGMIAGTEAARMNGRRLALAALRAEQVERAYAASRLHTLRLQLDPHFLFNALNTISAEVGRDARDARAMIEHLAILLRSSLDEGSRHAVCLADELAMLDHYLAIQRGRFGERLRVEFDVPDDVLRALVPSLMIQPLIENAIRHGLAPRRTGGTVMIAAARDGNCLRVTVTDDGVGLPADGSGGPREGVGLAVTRERVEQFDPEAAGRLRIERRPGGGTIVEITLPFHSKPIDNDA